ncbi:hypothetical protein PIB30_084629 [Stylosanthes scabra]|uniref:Uncharacterized protein n=1 Tax=Stylosanthes scabra TaxID=79078 RepID=A0ABU6YTZ8_9FABA|nr:hypothetical protein [Stylosanthes scabra]
MSLFSGIHECVFSNSANVPSYLPSSSVYPFPVKEGVEECSKMIPDLRESIDLTKGRTREGDFVVEISILVYGCQGAFPLDSLLGNIENITHYDKLKGKLTELGQMLPILPVGLVSNSPSATSQEILGASIPVSSNQPPPTQPPMASSVLRSVEVEREESLLEDPTADLKLKKRGRIKGVSYSSGAAKRTARKASATSPIAPEDDVSWEHDVDPFTIAFPHDFNYQKALDASLTTRAVRLALAPCSEEQLLGTAYTRFVGIEGADMAKRQMEKQLAAAKEQINLLIVECDYALAAPPLQKEIDQLKKKIELVEGDRLSNLDQLEHMKENAQEQIKWLIVHVDDLKVDNEALAKSLEHEQAQRKNAEAAATKWFGKYKASIVEAQESLENTFEMVMNQVRHLSPGVDFSAITLSTRWDPMSKCVRVPEKEPKGEAVKEGGGGV